LVVASGKVFNGNEVEAISTIVVWDETKDTGIHDALDLLSYAENTILRESRFLECDNYIVTSLTLVNDYQK